MEISVLTKFLLRLAKDNFFNNELNKDIKFKLALYDVNLCSLIYKTTFDTKYKFFTDIVNMFLDIEKYIEQTYCRKKNIVIYDIVNHDKLFKYLESNGAMWGSDKRCTSYKPIDNFGVGFYLKFYMDECRIYYGHSYTKCSDDIMLTEDEFYKHYENYKKKLNNVFYKCIKQNYGIFKKNHKL